VRGAPTVERLHGIVGEGRPEQVAADTLESLAVAAVDGGRRVQVHAEGRDRPRPRLGVGSGGGEARASELDTGRERGVEVELGSPRLGVAAPDTEPQRSIVQWAPWKSRKTSTQPRRLTLICSVNPMVSTFGRKTPERSDGGHPRMVVLS